MISVHLASFFSIKVLPLQIKLAEKDFISLNYDHFFIPFLPLLPQHLLSQHLHRYLLPHFQAPPMLQHLMFQMVV